MHGTGSVLSSDNSHFEFSTSTENVRRTSDSQVASLQAHGIMDPCVSQTENTAVTVKREEEDDIPPQQTNAEMVLSHPDIEKLMVIYRKGQNGTQTCGLEVPPGDDYVAEVKGTLAICKSIDAKAAARRAPKTFTEAIAATKLPGVSKKKGAMVRDFNHLIRKATSFFKLWNPLRALAMSGIQDMAHAKSIVKRAPPAVVVKHEKGVLEGDPSPTSSPAPAAATPSPPSTPLEMRDASPAKVQHLEDSPSPT